MIIDWLTVVANSLWIIGCAIALAALSRASWQSAKQQMKLRTVLGSAGYQIALAIAGGLFCLGLAGTARSVAEIILWLVLAVCFTGLAIAVIIQSRKSR